MSKKRIVVVLGMHRSGTSAIARGLKALHVDLGNNLMPGIAGENEKGFFEDLDIQKFNERLLAKSGNAWHSLSQVPTDQFEKHVYAAERIEAADLIERKLAQSQTFGFKDPRTALLLPFWQCLFRDLGISDSYLIVVRNPLEVAESLRKRGQTDPAHSAILWLKHNWAAIQHSTDRPRVCVSYARFLDDSFGQLVRIATALDLRMPAPSDPEFSEFASEFLETSLRHNRISDNEVMRGETLPRIVAPLYQTLLEWAEADPKQTLDVPPKLRKRVEAFWESADFILQFGDRIRNSATLARAARSKVEAELFETSATLEHTKSKLVESAANLLAAQGENEASRARLAEFERRLGALEDELSQTRASLASSMAEVAGLKADREAKAARIKEVEHTCAEATRAKADCRDQLEQVSKAKTDALASLADVSAQTEHLKTDLIAKNMTIREIESAKAEAEREAADLRCQLDAAQAQTRQLHADMADKLAARELSLREIEGAKAEAEREAADLRRQLDAARAQTRQLHTDMADKLAARELSLREFEGAKAEAEREAADLRRQLDAARAQTRQLHTDMADSGARLADLEARSAAAERSAADQKQLLDLARKDANRSATAFQKQLHEAAKAREDALSAARAQVERLQAAVTSEQTAAKKLVAQLAEYSQQADLFKAESDRMELQLSRAKNELAEKTKTVRLLRHEVLELRSSTSWKITEPLRASRRVLSMQLRAARRILGGGSSQPSIRSD